MTDIRYGIFLRPDAATCWTVTQVTIALQRQFGLVSAGAFPPHATLIGNLRTHASEKELTSALDAAFAGVQALPVYNKGIERNSDRYGYNLEEDATGTSINIPLSEVAQRVKEAVDPLYAPLEVDDFLTPGLSEYSFAAHLSLAAHELAVDNRLSDEVGEFLEGLPIEPPASFVARWYSLFEFKADWSGHWWEHMTWRHLRSWDVSTNSAASFAEA
jgi:hypothetical protein